MEIRCSSCNINVANLEGSVTFDCPKCDKEKITRCSQCRKTGARYVCAACGFEGPN